MVTASGMVVFVTVVCIVPVSVPRSSRLAPVAAWGRGTMATRVVGVILVSRHGQFILLCSSRQGVELRHKAKVRTSNAVKELISDKVGRKAV